MTTLLQMGHWTMIKLPRPLCNIQYCVRMDGSGRITSRNRRFLRESSIRDVSSIRFITVILVKGIFLIFHSPHAKLVEPIVIRFCREKIQRENYVKFFGISLDANQNRKHHVNELSKNLLEQFYDYFIIPCLFIYYI